ncbi:SIR2 family protein [Massilia putida]|uniref:SIR2 family protein n=1 Tax=Massilia putida TaxID=1141883 RepID=UPI0009535FFF|nr:SIR2 family protein [Massilia putida]
MKTQTEVELDYAHLASIGLGVDAFVRSLTVNRGRPVCFLVGAGASLTSGMPSAERCIWDWKRDIFVSNNPTLRETVGELTLEGTRKRIQSWLDRQGHYPQAGSEDEYSYFAQACYPSRNDRKSFFYTYVKKAVPHIGYRLIPLLVRAGLLRTLWTTNFDGLASRACSAADVVCVEVGMDSVARTLRPPVDGELRVVSMHGDYRYDPLKNTVGELAEQDESFRRALGIELKDCDLVVLGYSGRDESIMSILRKAYTSPGETRLFWCGFGAQPPKEVSSLIATTRNNGREAFYIPTDGFDDTITRLSLSYLDAEHLSIAKEIIGTLSTSQAPAKLFASPPIEPTTLFKSNAYPISFPGELFEAKLDFPNDVHRGKWLQEKLSSIHACGVATRDGAFLYGNPKDLQSALGHHLIGQIVSHAVSDIDIAKDPRIRSLVRKGLLLSFKRHLSTHGTTARIWEKSPYESRKHNGKLYSIHRALRAEINVIAGRPLAVLMPEVTVYDSAGNLAELDTAKVLQNQVYGYQHNNIFDRDLRHWLDRLVNIDIPALAGGLFRLKKAPWYAGISEIGKRPLDEKSKRFVKQSGVVVNDMPLLFSSRASNTEVRDIHPIRGLVTNRPWDFSLTSNGLAPQADLAVICPAPDANVFSRFLYQLNERATPPQTEQDYLLPYPGFTAAFGLPLVIPSPGDSGWQNINDRVEGDRLEAAKSLAQRLCRALDNIRSSTRPGAVTLIFVPSRWESLKVVQTSIESFNLHDYVKAYAARAGLSTQFLRAETVQSPQPCRVRWWLSLALYAKALRTPWRLDCIDDETAYVGIGYSIDQSADNGSHILLGCSHLYSSRGEGLQFRLGRLENSIIKGRNPFMSEDDARRTGETIRQLFFDAKMKLPSRVVVHKRTRFTEEEQRGLCQGLDGVKNVELIEINIDESLRYLASKKTDKGMEPDTFPVPRGTTIVLSGHSALVWVHGSALNIKNPKFRYYQGKRRIPAPLFIKRYMGQSDVMQVASEILGLSKMNWNHFDFYSQMPATLTSANSIAQVGSYLSAFGSAAYDYRLLI